MYLLEKVYNSRITLKNLLSNEWNTDIIHDVSLQELEVMYINQNENNYINSGCNITLTNRKIPSHKLHIIYYNFPQLHLTGTKINKTCCDKLSALYEQEGIESDDSLFDKEDSLLVIINEPISENIETNIENMYYKGLEELNSGLNPAIIKEMEQNNFVMNTNYFRNIHIFYIDTLIHNLLNHILVPKHIPIRSKYEIKTILSNTNATMNQLPVILRTDSMAKLIRLCPGDICKIIRKSDKCGENEYYRVCK